MERGSWAAARLWAAADIRGRWRPLVAVGLIAGLTAGLAIASLAGARRTDSALDRLRERTNASDVLLFPSQVGAYHPDWEALAQRPEVRALAPWALVFGQLEGEPDGLFFTPVDDSWMRDVDAPIIVAGRMYDPAADDELIVAEGFAAAEGIHVGDSIGFTPYTVDEEEGAPPPLRGPRLTMRIVGIMRTPMEELFVQDGFVVASPGIITRHPEVNYVENAVVQLVEPSAGTAALEAHATEDLAAGTPVLDLLVVARRVTTTTDVERSALLLLGAAIALASLVLAGQVVARSASLIGRDAHILEAMGMRRGAMTVASLLSHLPAVVVAVVTCTATAVVTSRWLPFGLARRLEPDRGMHLDTLVVLPGLLVLLGALLAGVALSTRLATAHGVQTTGDNPRGIIDWVRRHASPGVGIGATMAFRTRTGRRDLPVRPALLGAVVGMLGVASAITLDAGLHDALHHPERAGVTWDGQIAPGTPDAFTDDGFATEFVRDVQAAPGLTDLVQVDRTSVAVQAKAGIPAYALRPVESDETSAISFVTLDGRAPVEPGEAAIGPDTARSLAVEIGDTIAVGTPPVDVTVVGTSLFPAEVHAGFDQGAWLTPEDYDAIKPPADESTERYVAVRFAEGAERRGLDGLQAAAAPYRGFAGPAELPPELANLRQVRSIPKLLAAFLAALALAALLHVLVTTTRVRAHEFAVLRALGFTRWGARGVVNVQGTALFLTGLVLGTPVGVAAGRVGWRLIAERVPLEEASPMAVVAIAALVPVALIVAQLIAYGPGRQVVRRTPGEVLRAE